MCELFDPDANGKNGNSLRNAPSSSCESLNAQEITPILRAPCIPRLKFRGIHRKLEGGNDFLTMDLAATISTLNLDSVTTVEESIISKSDNGRSDKKYGTKSQPKPEQENNTDYKNLKQYRKNYKESVKQVKANERNDLRISALYHEEKMLAEHAARRELKRANEKTPEQKEEARKFYQERREVAKRKEIIRNKGNLSPLDFENDLTMDMRLRYFNRHHKCSCGKRFNIIFKGSEGYIVRCSHKTEVPSSVSTSKKCLTCGSSNLEIQASKCKCKNYFCHKCGGSNYFYKDIEDPESKIMCTAHQTYDCHPGSDPLNDVHLTIKIPDHTIETTEGPCPVVGSTKDVFFKQSVIARDVEKTYKPKRRLGSRSQFLRSLNNDVRGFNWAERVSGVKTKNTFEALDVEEPKIEESEEQGGMVSTAMSSSKSAALSAYKTVSDSIKNLLKEIRGMKDKILNSAKDSMANAIKAALAERFSIVIYFLEILQDNLDFEVCSNLAFILARCIQNGVFNFSSFFLNVAQLGLIAVHIGTQTSQQLEILKNLKFRIPEQFEDDPTKTTEVKNLDVSVLFTETFYSRHPNEQANLFRVDVLNKVKKIPSLRAIIEHIFANSTLLAKFISIKRDIGVGQRPYLMFSKAGVDFVQQKTLAYMLYLIGDVEEAGELGLEGLCNCISSTMSGLFSAGVLKDFLKFMREVSPFFAVYKGGKEIIKDVSKAISKFILGDLPPAEWLESEMYDESSPVHQLYSVYLAYISTTVPGSETFLKLPVTEIRTSFYQHREKCDAYVALNQKWSTKYSSWVNYMEKGMSTPPQPKEREFEPTVLVLHGPPGVGKSTIWPHIVGYALKLTPKQVRETTHTWNGASEYQPGMADKKIVLFDDFGQDRTKNEETLNLIRLCTSAPFMVNSANIVGSEIKGMFAQPEVIVICTNDQDLATDKVFSAPAVLRRMDLYLTLTEQLDFSKENAAEMPHFFVRQCGRYGEIEGKTLSLAHIAGLTKVIHRAKIDAYKAINKNLEVVFKEIDLEAILNAKKGNMAQLPDFIMTSGELQKDWKKYFEVSKVVEKLELGTANGGDMLKISQDLKKFTTNEISQAEMMLWVKPKLQFKGMMEFIMLELKAIEKKTLDPREANKAAGIWMLFNRLLTEFRREEEVNEQGTISRSMLEIELDSEEQSFTFPYLVSLASKFILNSTETVVAFTLPTYVIAAYATIYDDMKMLFRAPSISRFFRTLVKILSISIGGVCLAFAAYKVLNLINKPEVTEESGATRTARARAPQFIVNSVAESGVHEPIVNMIKAASGTLIAGNGRQINCLAIGGSWLLTAMHFFVDFNTQDGIVKEGTEMVCLMSTGAQFVPFKFEKHRFVKFDNHTELFDGSPVRPDIALYRMDEKIFPQFKVIIKHFWDGSYNTKNMPVMKIDYVPELEMGGERADLAGNLKCNFKQVKYELSTGFVEEDQVMTVRTKGFDRYFHCVATATYHGRDKSCGSAVIRTDIVCPAILGIHVAAVTRSGNSMFHFVTASELTRATSSHVMVSTQESKFIQYGAPLKYESDLPDTHQFYYLGTTDKKHRIFQPIKTDLTPSLLYESITPHITEPSILHKKDPRIPKDEVENFWPTMLEGYSKFTNLTYDDIEEATISVIVDNRKLQHKKRTTARVLTDEEVINGSSEFPTLGRVPQDTSCGWPYTCEGVKKSHLFKEVNDTLYMTPRLENDWREAELCLEDGTVPFLPFTATIKDERVKLSKIYEKPKSRIFMAGNVVNYMLNRKYYGWFLDMHSRSQWSYAITCLDRVSVEWHYFICSMIEVGPRGFDGDFKWWDKFINSVLKYAAFLVDIDGLITAGIIQKDSPKYCALRELKMRTFVIFGEAVYVSNGIEPSGELLTFMDNSTMNEIIHRTAYLQIMKRLSPMDANITMYRAKTRGGRGGDDTIQLVADSIIKYFNGRTFSEWCKSKNISLTAADKSETFSESTHFKALQFLKNTTGTMHGYYVPQQNELELIEQCYWVRLNANNKDIEKATEDNTNAALRGLYYWGKEKFNEIRNAFLAKAPQLNLLSFADLDFQWNKYGFFPGSHSDYATQTDQDRMRTFNPALLESKFDKSRQFGQISYTNPNMKIIESSEQAAIITGKDKASMSVAQTHPEAPLDEHVPPKTVQVVPPAKSSNVIGSESKVNGAFIQSKEIPVQMQLRTGQIKVAPLDFRAQGHLNDRNWTLSKLASKFTSLGQVQWPISAAPGTILKKWNLPNDILTTPALKTPFDVTAYERFQNITFKITSSASPFYAGRLIAGFYPSMQATNTSPENLHLLLTQLGGVVLNPTDNQTIEYSVPYRHYLNWLEYPHDIAGQFYVVVLNSLQTGSNNVNNVTISVFVSIENAQFKVPEYIGATTKSQAYKSINSTPQSGNTDLEDTAIVISKKVNSVNEDYQRNATTMCAGTGVYVEPLIKQFPDHPVDLIQMLKRDVLFSHEEFSVQAGTAAAPGFSALFLPYMDLYNAATRECSALFGMFRGSLMIKFSGYGFYENEERSNSWEGKAFHLNQDLPITYQGSLENYNQYGGINIGYHKFDQDHPACFTVPHWSPNFASYSRGEPVVNETPQSFIVLEMYNFSPKPIAIRGTIEVRVDDDFTMGVFLGFGPMSFVPVPALKKIVKKKWRCSATPITRTNNASNVSSDYIILSSQNQSGIINEAQDWVNDEVSGAVDYVADKAKSAIKTGIDSVFDLAKENMEPVMDIVDFVGNLLDAPPLTLQAAPYMPRKWNYGNANNIMQFCEKLGATNHNGGCYTDKTTYGTDVTETNMYDLMRNVKTLWKTIKWPVSAAAGSMLNYFLVGCNGTEDVLNNNSKVACPMDAFAKFFNYWSGSIIYALDVVSSQMHTGRLVVSFHPNITTLPQGFTLDQATQQYFLSFDLDKGKGCAVIEIPYLFKRPFKPIPLLDSVGSVSYPFYDGFNGIVCIWVMNPLRASETVSNSVDINLYKMAGADFRFEGYGSTTNASMRW